jgi:hypothetical protein
MALMKFLDPDTEGAVRDFLARIPEIDQRQADCRPLQIDADRFAQHVRA